MKNRKIRLLIATQLIIILLARWVFVNTSTIAEIAREKGLQEDLLPPVQNLYILQFIILFVAFLVVFGLMIQELTRIKKEKNNLTAFDTSDKKDNLQQETEERERREKEEEQRRKQQLEKKKAEMLACVEKGFKDFKEKAEKSRSEKLLSCISNFYEIAQAEIFLRKTVDEQDKLALSATYAFYVPDEKVFEFELGEGLIGQVAKAGKPITLTELPEGYIIIKSGLGSASPSHLAIIPWNDANGKTFAVLEIASFKPFQPEDVDILLSLTEKAREIYG